MPNQTLFFIQFMKHSYVNKNQVFVNNIIKYIHRRTDIVLNLTLLNGYSIYVGNRSYIYIQKLN